MYKAWMYYSAECKSHRSE